MCPYINFGIFSIPAYGLMMTLGIFLCSFFVLLKAKRLGVGIEEMIIVISISMGAAILCAGSLYIFVSYSIKEIVKNILSGDFAFLKNVGLVFYGGLIGGIAGGIIASKWQKLDMRNVEQCIVPVLPLGHAIGRIGCLFAGCCHGFEYDGPFAVKSLLISAEKTFFPIQAVEALLNLGIFIFLLRYAKNKRPSYNILCVYLLLYSILRFILEFYRGDLIRGTFLFFSTSQWISIAIFLASTLLLYIKKTEDK